MQYGLSKTTTPNKLEFLRHEKTLSHCAVAVYQDDDEIAVGLQGAAQLRDKELRVKQEVQVPGLGYTLYMSKDYMSCRAFDKDQFSSLQWSPGTTFEATFQPESFEGDPTLSIHQKAMTDTRTYFFERLTKTSYTVPSLKDRRPARRRQFGNTTVYYSEEDQGRLTKFKFDPRTNEASCLWHTLGLEKPSALEVDESGLIYLATGIKKKSIMLVNQQGNLKQAQRSWSCC